MNLLTIPFESITFKDVVDFCKEGVIEGVQLDYKSIVPKDLTKHFVTFSNTLGGLIVIGVGEDENGLPNNYEGILVEGKEIDRIHQFASNVVPLPSYAVKVTDEDKNGKAFILIKINEGSSPPYHSQSDPTVWVRTGNVSTPIKPANREDLLALVSKKDDASEIRTSNNWLANHLYEQFLKEAEEERKQRLQSGENVYNQVLGSIANGNCAILSISIQPNHPKDKLVLYSNMMKDAHNYFGSYHHSSAFSGGKSSSIPGGIGALYWNHTYGVIYCDQLYDIGLLHRTVDVLRLTDGKKDIYLLTVAEEIYRQLMIYKSVIGHFGYSGILNCSIRLLGAQGAELLNINFDGFRHNSTKIKMQDYNWEFQTDSSQITDQDKLNSIFIDKLQEIAWDMGISNLSVASIEDMIKKNNW